MRYLYLIIVVSVADCDMPVARAVALAPILIVSDRAQRWHQRTLTPQDTPSHYTSPPLLCTKSGFVGKLEINQDQDRKHSSRFNTLLHSLKWMIIARNIPCCFHNYILMHRDNVWLKISVCWRSCLEATTRKAPIELKIINWLHFTFFLSIYKEH